jgi:hypothetical protein
VAAYYSRYVAEKSALDDLRRSSAIMCAMMDIPEAVESLQMVQREREVKAERVEKLAREVRNLTRQTIQRIFSKATSYDEAIALVEEITDQMLGWLDALPEKLGRLKQHEFLVPWHSNALHVRVCSNHAEGCSDPHHVLREAIELLYGENPMLADRVIQANEQGTEVKVGARKANDCSGETQGERPPDSNTAEEVNWYYANRFRIPEDENDVTAIEDQRWLAQSIAEAEREAAGQPPAPAQTVP